MRVVIALSTLLVFIASVVSMSSDPGEFLSLVMGLFLFLILGLGSAGALVWVFLIWIR